MEFTNSALEEALAFMDIDGGFESGTNQVYESDSSTKSTATSHPAINTCPTPPTEAKLREEILRIRSQNIIKPDIATSAWVESFMRDCNKIRQELDVAERQLKGDKGEGKRTRVGGD